MGWENFDWNRHPTWVTNQFFDSGESCFPYRLARVGANLITRQHDTPQRSVLLSTLARLGGSEFGNQKAPVNSGCQFHR